LEHGIVISVVRLCGQVKDVRYMGGR